MQRFFRAKVTGWWNSLSPSLFDVSDLSLSLYAHLAQFLFLCVYFVCICMYACNVVS